VPLVSCLAIPPRCLHAELRHAASQVKHVSQAALCQRATLVSCLPIPSCRLYVGLRHAAALGKHQPQLVLRVRVPLVSCLTISQRSPGLRHPVRLGDATLFVVGFHGPMDTRPFQSVRPGCATKTRLGPVPKLIQSKAMYKPRSFMHSDRRLACIRWRGKSLVVEKHGY
jgi:hypothetical protein